MNSPRAAAFLAHPEKLFASPCSRALQQIRSVRPMACCASRGSIDNGHDSTSQRSSRTAASHSPEGSCTSSSNTENCPTMYCCVTETSKNAPRSQRTAQRRVRQQAQAPQNARRDTPAGRRYDQDARFSSQDAEVIQQRLGRSELRRRDLARHLKQLEGARDRAAAIPRRGRDRHRRAGRDAGGDGESCRTPRTSARTRSVVPARAGEPAVWLASHGDS